MRAPPFPPRPIASPLYHKTDRDTRTRHTGKIVQTTNHPPTHTQAGTHARTRKHTQGNRTRRKRARCGSTSSAHPPCYRRTHSTADIHTNNSQPAILSAKHTTSPIRYNIIYATEEDEVQRTLCAYSSIHMCTHTHKPRPDNPDTYLHTYGDR